MRLPANYPELLSKISAQELEPDLRDEVLRRLAHPKFTEAALAYRLIFAEDVENHEQSTIISSSKLIYIYQLIIYFHGQRRLNKAKRTKVLGAMKAHLTETDVSSRRRVITLISRLVDIGHVIRETNPSDQRVKWLVPTPAMLDFCMAGSRPVHEPLPLLGTPPEMLAKFRASREVQEDTFFYFSKSWTEGRNPLTYFKTLRQFMKKSQAVNIVNDLLLIMTNEYGSIYTGQPIAFNVNQLSERHRVSRTHVRNLLASLAKDGHIEVDSEDRHIRISQEFAFLDDCIAALLFVVFGEALESAIATPLPR